MAVVVDFYQGAYGPTLRIDMLVREELLMIADLFEALASRASEEADFFHLTHVEAGGVSTLLMSSVSHSPDKNIVVRSVERQGASLLWSGSPAYWQECAEKARALEARNRPGHQYLTTEGVDDALIELCYQETP